MFQIYSRCSVCEDKSKGSCLEFNSKCTVFKLSKAEAEQYRPTKLLKTAKEIAAILELSETTIRGYIKKIDLKHYSNFQDNKGSWRASYTYYTYDLEELFNGLLTIKKDSKAQVIKEYIENETKVFDAFIDSLIKPKKEVQCHDNKDYKGELRADGRLYHVLDESDSTYTIVNEKRMIKSYDKSIFTRLG